MQKARKTTIQYNNILNYYQLLRKKNPLKNVFDHDITHRLLTYTGKFRFLKKTTSRKTVYYNIQIRLEKLSNVNLKKEGDKFAKGSGLNMLYYINYSNAK